MHILYVITSLRKAAGTSVFCAEVANELVASGHDVTIAVCNPNQSDLYPLDSRIHLVSIESIFHSTPTPNAYTLVHIHALWSWPLHKVSCWAHAHSIPVVWSPHGMITPWAMKNKRLKKLLGWYLYQKRDLQRAALLHATAQSEVDDIRRVGIKVRVVVAPLGVRIQKSKLKVEVEERRCASDSLISNWHDIVDPAVIFSLKTTRIILSDPALCDRRAVKDVFKSFGLVENAFDGRKVSFPSKSVGKMLGQRGIDLYRVAGSFAELFRSSRRAWSETEAEIENHRVHRNIGAYHQYIARFNDGKDECFVRFTVREERGGRIARNEVHSSTVSRITVYKAKGVELSNLGHAQAEDSTPFVDNKIAYFLAGVNQVNSTVNLNLKPQPKTLLFVSRVQRKKGLPMLLDAWARLPADIKQGWHIRIVGPDQDNHTAELMSQCDRLGLSYSTPEENDNISTVDLDLRPRPSVEFVGPKYGDDLTREYASANLFILPTHSENFGSVVLESLAQAVPVICTKGAPWEELERFQCGMWIDTSVGAIRAALANMLALDDAGRSAMGARGLELVKMKYTWTTVAESVKAAYETMAVGNGRLLKHDGAGVMTANVVGK